MTETAKIHCWSGVCHLSSDESSLLQYTCLVFRVVLQAMITGSSDEPKGWKKDAMKARGSMEKAGRHLLSS